MIRKIAMILALAVVVGLPFVFRPPAEERRDYDRELVVVTPHNEAIRHELSRGFRDWYEERTGEVVRVDWRIPGGTSEIARLVASEYQAAFRNYWIRELGEPWSRRVLGAFDNPRMVLRDDPDDDSV